MAQGLPGVPRGSFKAVWCVLTSVRAFRFRLCLHRSGEGEGGVVGKDGDGDDAVVDSGGDAGRDRGEGGCCGARGGSPPPPPAELDAADDLRHLKKMPVLTTLSFRGCPALRDG